VPGDQDALPVVTLDDVSQGRASAGEVLVPRLGAGRVRPIGIGVGRATERGFDLVPGAAVGLAVVRASEARLDMDGQLEPAGQDFR
jgi:hypothetical protein